MKKGPLVYRGSQLVTCAHSQHRAAVEDQPDQVETCRHTLTFSGAGPATHSVVTYLVPYRRSICAKDSGTS